MKIILMNRKNNQLYKKIVIKTKKIFIKYYLINKYYIKF